MHLFYISAISACSILLPCGATLFRWSRMKEKYLPLTLLLALGILNETTSFISLHYCANNTVNGNIYVLADFLLVVWLFARLDTFISKIFLSLIMVSGLILWIADNLLLHSLSANNSMFRMVASLIIVYISIDKVNQLLFFSSPIRLKNTDLLLSIGFLTYHAYKTFVEAFHVFPMPKDRAFYEKLWVILGIINMVTNLLFTLAILCIRQKQEFTLRLSRALRY